MTEGRVRTKQEQRKGRGKMNTTRTTVSILAAISLSGTIAFAGNDAKHHSSRRYGASSHVTAPRHTRHGAHSYPAVRPSCSPRHGDRREGRHHPPVHYRERHQYVPEGHHGEEPRLPPKEYERHHSSSRSCGSSYRHTAARPPHPAHPYAIHRALMELLRRHATCESRTRPRH